MNTGLVNKLMELIPGFQGTFPCDMLPRTQPNMSFIVNTESSRDSGEHWTAVYITEKYFYFFDSFGRGINQFEEPFKGYMKKASRQFYVRTSSQDLQYIFSDVCGLWCIYFLWCKYTSFKFMFRHFSNDNLDNDEKLKDIMDFLNRLLPNYLTEQFKFDFSQYNKLFKLKNTLHNVKRLRANIKEDI